MSEHVYGTGIVSCPKCGSVNVKSEGGKQRRCLKCGYRWTAKKSILPPTIKRRRSAK